MLNAVLSHHPAGYRAVRALTRLLLLVVLLPLSLLLLPENRLQAADLQLSPEERAYLDSRQKLRVYGLDSYPPFSFIEEGVLQGYSVDYMRLIGRQLDIRIEFVEDAPWFKAMEMLEQGELDIIPSMAQTAQRSGRFTFTRFNHIEHTSGAIFKSQQANSPLGDRVIAVARDTFLHEHLSQNYPEQQLLITPSTERAVQAVSYGQADIAVGSLPALNYYLQKNWLTDLKTGQVSGLILPPVSSLPMALTRGNHLLNGILDKVQQQLPYSEIVALKERWRDVSDRSTGVRGLSAEEVQFLKNRRRFTLCVDPSWLPFEAVDEQGHIGIAADMIDLFARRLEIRFERVESASWQESLRLGREGLCDLFPMIMPAESRESFLQFTRPVIKTPLVLVTDIRAPYVTDLKKLSAVRIGVVDSYAFHAQLEERYPQLEFVTVSDINQGLQRVRDGELFGYIDSLIGTGYWIQDRYNGQLKVSAEIDDTWQLSMGVRKDLQPLTGILNKVIAETQDQELQNIVQKWVAIRYQQRTNWWVTLLIVLATVLILGGVLAWYMRLNRRLIREVARREAAEKAALELAHTDQLTGVLNRHGSDELFRQEIARSHRQGSPVCLMIMDIDHFKRVNDEFGHKTGDDVLRLLAQTLNGRMRATDHLVRWGGEEFLVLLPDTGLAQAQQLAEEFRQLIENAGGRELPRFTISLGVARLEPGEDFNAWYQRVDNALYQAKESGRNRVCAA